jgi:hypothetical protein
MGGVIWTREPGCPPRRIGKLVNYGGKLVYNFDGVTIYRRLQALGIADCVLALMVRENVREVHYTIGSATYTAKLDDVLEHGFRNTMDGSRLGYMYLGLKHWTIDEQRRSYPWVGEDTRINLEWVVNPPEIVMAKARIVAARPVEPRQMGLFA